MGVKSKKVLEAVSGWEGVQLVVRCVVLGLWELSRGWVLRLWKGPRRRPGGCPPVELTVDSSVGTHCYIKIMGVKYHYVEIGPRGGQVVLVLGDAPESFELGSARWARLVRRLAAGGQRVVTLDLRGAGGSEGGSRGALAPPQAVKELAKLMEALGVSEAQPAAVVGFGLGGMLAWYLVHSRGSLVRKFAAVGAPHPDLYWAQPPAPFCEGLMHFIQWPHLPERWLAAGAARERRWATSRPKDWTGALNYVRGAGWWRIRAGHRLEPEALLVGAPERAAQLVASAQRCASATLRLVPGPGPQDQDLTDIILDFLIEKEKPVEVESRTLVGRMLGAVADRGRELTAKLV